MKEQLPNNNILCKCWINNTEWYIIKDKINIHLQILTGGTIQRPALGTQTFSSHHICLWWSLSDFMSVIHEQEKKKRDLIYYVTAVVATPMNFIRDENPTALAYIILWITGRPNHIAHIQWKNTCPKEFRIHGLKEEWQIYSTKSKRKQVTWELQ